MKKKMSKKNIIREICGFAILCSLIMIVVGFFAIVGCEDPMTHVINYGSILVGLAMIVSGVLCGYEANRIGNRV